MYDLREELHDLLKIHPEQYCPQGKRILLNATPREYVDYGCKENNFLIWHWGEDRVTNAFLIKYRDFIAENGCNISFNKPEKDTDILFVINGGEYDFTDYQGKIAIKGSTKIKVSDAQVWAFGESVVSATGEADCLMYGNATLLCGARCHFELFDKAIRKGI